MKNTQDQERDFVFLLMIELLDEVAPNTKKLFIDFKEGMFSLYKEELLKGIPPEEISNLIRTFTLYHLLLNIVDERSYLEKSSRISLHKAFEQLKEEGYDKEDILSVLKKIRFYPVFTAHPTESLRRTFLESYHEIYDDLHLWCNYKYQDAREHLKYRLNLLWRSLIVRSAKIEVLLELDN